MHFLNGFYSHDNSHETVKFGGGGGGFSPHDWYITKEGKTLEPNLILIIRLSQISSFFSYFKDKLTGHNQGKSGTIAQSGA